MEAVLVTTGVGPDKSYLRKAFDKHNDKLGIFVSHTRANKDYIGRSKNVVLAVMGHVRKSAAFAEQESDGHEWRVSRCDYSPNISQSNAQTKKAFSDRRTTEESAVFRWFKFIKKGSKKFKVEMRTYSMCILDKDAETLDQCRPGHITDDDCKGSWDNTNCAETEWSFRWE